MSELFAGLRELGFDVRSTYHADAILTRDFPDAVAELESILGAVSIPLEELVRGGGGESSNTQRMRRALAEAGWPKVNFEIEKRINDVTTQSQTHEVDHVKHFRRSGNEVERGQAIALEIEWNNKDPFFNRDLDNYKMLHADGAISVGIIVTRGRSLQDGIEARIRTFVEEQQVESFDDLDRLFDLNPTRRQRQQVEKRVDKTGLSFSEVWTGFFVSDKYGPATTHWAKLEAQMERGVGSPCPIVGIGLPLSIVVD